MAYCSGSQKIWLFIVIISLLFAALTTSAVLYAWLTIAILFAIILMIDYMFMEDKDFLYDPDYKTWKQKTQVDQ